MVTLVHVGEAQHTVLCRNRQKSRVWSQVSGGESVSWGTAESQVKHHRHFYDYIFFVAASLLEKKIITQSI